MKHGRWYFFEVGEGEKPFEHATVVYMSEAFKPGPTTSYWMIPEGK